MSSMVAARTAAAMYAGGGLLGLIEGAIPGGPRFSVVPSVTAPVLGGSDTGYRDKPPSAARSWSAVQS